jgi:hypothetical protein
MTFPKDITDHNKQNLTQKCIYMVGQFKGKDDTLYAQYKERLATLKPEESWDFFHEMLVAYQNLSGTTPSTSSKPQPKVAAKKPEAKKPEQKKASAPVAKVVAVVKKTVEKAVAKVEKKVEKEVKKAVKKVAKKVAKSKPAAKAPAKKSKPTAVAAPKKKAPAKKAPAKKAAPKKAAKKKKK